MYLTVHRAEIANSVSQVTHYITLSCLSLTRIYRHAQIQNETLVRFSAHFREYTMYENRNENKRF